MLSKQEKELFCFMHGVRINIYTDCEQTVANFCRSHSSMLLFCDSQQELSIWMEGVIEKMAVNGTLSALEAHKALRQEVLAKLSMGIDTRLTPAMENQLIRAYLLGRSGK